MPLALRGRNGRAEPSVHIDAKEKESESTTRSGTQPCSKAICKKKKKKKKKVLNLPLGVVVRQMQPQIT